MNKTILSLIVICGVAAMPLACGSTTDSTASAGASSGGAAHAGTGGGSVATAGGGASSGGADPMAGAAGQADGAPEAPMIKSVEPLEGALHVMWMNMTKDCDKIELLRSKDGGAYAVAYTLTGAADSQHDTQAKPPGKYCYEARCIKGGQTSPDSDPLCGKP